MAWVEHRAGIKTVSRTQKKGRISLLLKGMAWLVGMAYFLTSAVVIVNAFVWLPTMPSAWYQVQRILYWPFQPYFALALDLLGRPNISYPVYATVTWSPFLLLSIVLPIALLRRRVGE
ncbi:MAG: hypothetical protein HY672_03300 [Chloroflexi bacterium]|nr:hypothetical protein [Chloroflexota bacterium]